MKGFTLRHPGRRSMELALSLVALGTISVGVAAIGAGAAPALVSATPKTSAACTVNLSINLSPGISMTPSSGSLSTSPAGRIDCIGTVDGSQITGPGTLDLQGVYGATGGDTCLSGLETGTATATVPTSGGTEVLVATFSVHRTLTVGQLTASGEYGTVAGTLVGTPRSGTCVLSPITAIDMTGPATVSGP